MQKCSFYAMPGKMREFFGLPRVRCDKRRRHAYRVSYHLCAEKRHEAGADTWAARIEGGVNLVEGVVVVDIAEVDVPGDDVIKR